MPEIKEPIVYIFGIAGCPNCKRFLENMKETLENSIYYFQEGDKMNRFFADALEELLIASQALDIRSYPWCGKIIDGKCFIGLPNEDYTSINWINK